MIQKGLTYIFTADKTWFVDIECFVVERSVRNISTLWFISASLFERDKERIKKYILCTRYPELIEGGTYNNNYAVDVMALV